MKNPKVWYRIFVDLLEILKNTPIVNIAKAAVVFNGATAIAMSADTTGNIIRACA
jgi:hypothetical protein